MTSRAAITSAFANALDLVVDLATLGEYGVEERSSAPQPCTTGPCDQDRHFAAWETLVTPRRGTCDRGTAVGLAVTS